MHNYSQTILQLFNQLRNNGYSKEDIEFIYRTYQVAIQKFSGIYRPSGKTFLSHTIGVASILVSLNVPISTITAGLIHSIYNEGDFGVVRKKITNSKRKQVRKLVGEDVEAYVYSYAGLIPDHNTLSYINENFDKLDPTVRQVLLIRLADLLEDCLDLGSLYCSNLDKRQNFYNKTGPIILELALKLGFNQLSTRLESAFNEALVGKLFEGIQGPITGGQCYLIPPASYRKRWRIIVFRYVKICLIRFFHSKQTSN